MSTEKLIIRISHFSCDGFVSNVQIVGIQFSRRRARGSCPQHATSTAVPLGSPPPLTIEVTVPQKSIKRNFKVISSLRERSSYDVRLALEPGGERIEVHFLQIVGAARSGREAEVGVLRAALILGDDVLVERACLLTVEPISQSMVRGAPTDQHIVPVAICGVASLTDRELVADAAGCQGSAGLEEVRVIAGHVSDIGVLISVEGDAEAVLDPDRAVVARHRRRWRSPRVDHFAAQTPSRRRPWHCLPR